MKRIISKIKKTLHNSGSSLVLVIVALAFIGILVGSLLTSVAYVYRQKLYDYNARSNFYYLDQAMDEVYAGVGGKTVGALTDAYEKTREEIITFDIKSKSYKAMDEDEANEKFKNYFMSSFIDGSNTDFWKIIYDKEDAVGTVHYYSDPACTAAVSADVYKKSIVYAIRTMITNTSVKLDTSKMKLQYVYVKADGTSVTRDTVDTTFMTSQLAKIVLKGVRLTREAEYNRSNAKGKFKQSISSDIEISRPDFNVSFGNNMVDISTLFDYCLVADSGVDFDRISGDVLTISGNVYAANDFYNKDYNQYETKAGFTDEFTWTLPDGTTTETFKMNKVSAYSYTAPDAHSLYNNGQVNSRLVAAATVPYDGKNDRSKYSGFYVDGGRVNILADTVIVPGSIAVMNGGSLSVYGINSTDVKATDVWADEIILGGYSLPGLTKEDGKGASANFNANLYVKDDTQLEADFSKFKLTGSYYGFSNSESQDQRSFIPTVAKQKASDLANIYEQQKKDDAGNDIIENRGHYNSSSILLNGERATLDLEDTVDLFVGGRSYIELSNTKVGASSKIINANKGISTENNIEVKEKEFEYSASLSDYKTGESVSVKSAQLAYYPSKASGSLTTDKKYFNLTSGSSGSSLNSMYLFKKYFGYSNTAADSAGSISIPLISQEVVIGQGTSNEKTKTYYYFDFNQAALDLYRAQMNGATGAPFTTALKRFMSTTVTEDNNSRGLAFPTSAEILRSHLDEYADALKRSFIKDYSDFFNFCVNKNTETKINFLGYETDYDDPSIRTTYTKITDPTAFAAKYPEVDTNVLDDNTERDLINKRAAELQNITNYQDFVINNIIIPDNKSMAATSKINASGVVTKTNNEVLDEIVKGNPTHYTVTELQDNNDDTISSNLLGNAEGEDNVNKTNSKINTKNFAGDYELHYNLVKYALKDVYTDTAATGQSESQFIQTMIAANGEAGITPLNYYMNFDELTDTINPSNLDLGEYKVWASENDVTITGASEITGIIVTKGDVYFENVNKFSGLIICGGKVYVTTLNEDLTSINSTSLCRNIINEVISKASNYESTDPAVKDEAIKAVEFLKLFKSYHDIAEKAENGELTPSSDKKEITNIDYSDVLRYNNWMRNVD